MNPWINTIFAAQQLLGLKNIRYFALLILLSGCDGKHDPFDPLIGPRHPRPGTKSYLQTREDIPQDQKDALLNYKPCQVEILRILSTASVREVRAMVAANPSVDLPLLETLANDKEPAVRQYVVANNKTPHSILLKLKSDPDENVKWELPRNPNWTPEEIREMYNEKATSKMIFALNPTTPIDILEELSTLDSYSVRSEVARNPSINEVIVKRLSEDSRPSVRLMLIYNKATSTEVLRKLSLDADQDVRERAENKLKKRMRSTNN
jgi:hypothetical protein